MRENLDESSHRRTTVAFLAAFVLICGLPAGCDDSPCDRLEVRDNRPWIQMDCSAGDVTAVNNGTCGEGAFEFSCKGDDEISAGAFVNISRADFSTDCEKPIESFAAAFDGHGCCWDKESGGHDCCVTINDTKYGDCDDSSYYYH